MNLNFPCSCRQCVQHEVGLSFMPKFWAGNEPFNHECIGEMCTFIGQSDKYRLSERIGLYMYMYNCGKLLLDMISAALIHHMEYFLPFYW